MPSNWQSRYAAEKLGTGIEREPDAEGLLARGALGPLQLPGDLRRRRFLARHRLQLTDFGRSPRTPLLLPLSHNASLSRKPACIPYGCKRKAVCWMGITCENNCHIGDHGTHGNSVDRRYGSRVNKCFC